jgi:uncharacterized membrane protein (UPF0127 family)
MNVVLFETAAEQAEGLQHRPFIEPDTLFVFPFIKPGTVFHSRNVREPFDLAFLSYGNVVLEKRTIQPTEEVAVAPEGTWTAIESRAGWMDYWKFLPGYKVLLPAGV